MKNTDYINNLENTIANLKKELEELVNKEELEIQRNKYLQETSIAAFIYCREIKQYCTNENINLDTIITNQFVEYLIKKNKFQFAKYKNHFPEHFVNRITYEKALDMFDKQISLMPMVFSYNNHSKINEIKINSLQKELHYATASLEAINLLKDIKQLLTKNE